MTPRSTAAPRTTAQGGGGAITGETATPRRVAATACCGDGNATAGRSRAKRQLLAGLLWPGCCGDGNATAGRSRAKRQLLAGLLRRRQRCGGAITGQTATPRRVAAATATRRRGDHGRNGNSSQGCCDGLLRRRQRGGGAITGETATPRRVAVAGLLWPGCCDGLLLLGSQNAGGGNAVACAGVAAGVRSCRSTTWTRQGDRGRYGTNPRCVVIRGERAVDLHPQPGDTPPGGTRPRARRGAASPHAMVHR